MNILIFALVLIFLASNIWVEYHNEGQTFSGVVFRWWQQPMSAYLTGVKGAGIQSIGFLLLALAEILMAIFIKHDLVWTILLLVSAGALALVVATKRWLLNERVHVIAAGAAFGTAIAAELIYLWGHSAVWFPLFAILVPAAFMKFLPAQSAVEEKLTAALVCAGLITIVGVPL